MLWAFHWQQHRVMIGFFFFLIAMLQRDNITMIQKHKTESKTEATSLLEAVRGSRSLLVEILNGWCKAGDGVREEVQLPLKERIKHASIHHCLHWKCTPIKMRKSKALQPESGCFTKWLSDYHALSYLLRMHSENPPEDVVLNRGETKTTTRSLLPLPKRE